MTIPAEQLDTSTEHQNSTKNFYDDITRELLESQLHLMSHSEIRILKKMRELRTKIPLARQQVLAGAEEFELCPRKWPIPCHSKNSMEMPKCNMASEAVLGKTQEDIFHDLHLELHERMQNPVAFHAEMMGDIMYLHQGLKQKDAPEFVEAVVRDTWTISIGNS
jgi:hypothetical protein